MVEWKNIIVILQVYQSALVAILSFALFFRHGNYSKKYLGWFMVLSALFALSKVICSEGSSQMYRYVLPVNVAMLLSFFPLFYFYLKSLIISNYHFGSRELTHLLPAFLLFLLPVPFILQANEVITAPNPLASEPGHSWPDVIRYAYNVCVYGYFCLQIIIYSIRIGNLYKLHQSNIGETFSYTHRIKLYWVITLMTLFLAFLFLLGISQFIGLHKNILFQNWINGMEFLIILTFAIFAILQQDIYVHREAGYFEKEILPHSAAEVFEKEPNACVAVEYTDIPRVEAVNATIEPCEEDDCCRVKKYAGSGLSQPQKKMLGKKLDKLMKEKIYLNGKLTIEEVALKLDTNSKYLSQVINELHQQNFYTYINTHRVLEAQQLLKDIRHQKYSIQGIARMVGFSSKSSFNEAFRRSCEMTPSEYVERVGLGKSASVA